MKQPTRIRSIRKLTQSVKLKSSQKIKAKKWLKKHGETNASDIEMKDVPDYVLDYINNICQTDKQVNTSFDEEELDK